MRTFAMVSTNSSQRYTPSALESFFRCTELASGDAFFLIDNDSSLAPEGIEQHPQLQLLRNDQPLSFAANVNQIIRRTADSNADLFFLNNDLVFTPRWLEPLLLEQPALLSPLSNREVHYRRNGFSCERTLELEDYLGRENDLLLVAEYHGHKHRGYHQVLSLPFFCIKLPHTVYSRVGLLDESFGKGGAEDNDYCVRTVLAGFHIAYAVQSYILHFNGKSTWSGAETPEQTQQRCANFNSVFTAKWGEQLKRLLIDYDNSVLSATPAIASSAERRDFKHLVELLLPPGGQPR